MLFITKIAPQNITRPIYSDLRQIERIKNPLETAQRTSRRSITTQNGSETCFFCDEKGENETLHECQTLYLDVRVRKIAQEMQITKLLTKLSEGDMVATEAKYHRTCLLKLYNKYRDFNKEKFESHYKEEFVLGLAMSEVIHFIEENVQNSDTSPVFMLKDLKSMYEQSLADNGLRKYIHSTRFEKSWKSFV